MSLQVNDALSVLEGLKSNFLTPLARAEEVLRAAQNAANQLPELQKKREYLVQDVQTLETALAEGNAKLKLVQDQAAEFRTKFEQDTAERAEAVKAELAAARETIENETAARVEKARAELAGLQETLATLHKQKGTLESSLRQLQASVDLLKRNAARL